VEKERRKRKKEMAGDAKLPRILAHALSHLIWGTDIFQMLLGKATFDGWMTLYASPEQRQGCPPTRCMLLRLRQQIFFNYI
jgi:hypothetical protein